ncbi:glycerol-3-phosphate acyltransferase, partial [candidate division WOR-3 bacterium]|nr:glycerol-3-phosphate acyltransferase [candidate division WOR-3 bacterium]
MNLILKYGAFSLFSYLIGSIPNGYIITKIKLRKDIRKLGNYKNIGATNVFTSVSPMAGFLTLILDIVKGFIPVFMAKQFHLNQYYILLIGVLAILGHIYPVYIGFKGGTGMATTLGIL